MSRLALSLVFTLLVSHSVFALNVTVMPKEVIPGDVFVIKVEADGGKRIEAEFNKNKFNFYPDGETGLMAIVPVDIDIKPGKYTVRIIAGDERPKAEIIVKRHTFTTIKLTLPEAKVTLGPKDQERANREAEKLDKIWPEITPPAWKGRFSAPVRTEVSTGFGVRRIMNEKKTSVHRGMDYRGDTGTPVTPINAGTVILTDDLFFGGNTLIIDHGMGLYSVYMHLSRFNVSHGDRVSRDQVIGFVGSSGRATGPHLHMSIRLNGISINPESLFKLEL